MPQVFNIGPFVVFFWSNENNPLEPIHVHVSEKKPVENATKFWITKSGKAILANNNSKYSERTIGKLLRVIEANTTLIKEKWIEYFGEITYFC